MTVTSESLRAFIQENFLFGREPDFADDDSFLELGVIDSTGVLELVAFLEEQYGFHVEDDDLTPENLDSVNNILAYVQRKTQHINVSA